MKRNGTNKEFELNPQEDDLLRWVVKLQGPEDTPFCGGAFEIHMRVPESYPMAPPSVTFNTKIFHPNIHWKVCSDFL